MSQSHRILYCHCKHARVIAPEVKEGVLKALCESGVAFDAVPDLIAILDTQYRIVRVNQAMAQRLGISAEACVGQTCYSCVHGTDEPPLSVSRKNSSNPGAHL